MSMANDNVALMTGAVASSASIAAIGGTASTMSAASMVSTLAWLGGGSMALGGAVIAAIPLVIGAAGYGTYKLLTYEPDKCDHLLCVR